MTATTLSQKSVENVELKKLIEQKEIEWLEAFPDKDWTPAFFAEDVTLEYVKRMLAELRKSIEGQRKDPKLFLQGEDQVIVRTWNQALDWFLSELLGTTEEKGDKI